MHATNCTASAIMTIYEQHTRDYAVYMEQLSMIHRGVKYPLLVTVCCRLKETSTMRENYSTVEYTTGAYAVEKT